jgi:hypothetical protein
MVQAIATPGRTAVALDVFVTPRSEEFAGAIVTDAESLAAFGSLGTLDWRDAVFTIAPACITSAVIARRAVRLVGRSPTVHRPVASS